MPGEGPDVLVLEAEMDSGIIPHVDADARLEVDGQVQEFHDVRKAKLAAEHLGRIPSASQVYHLVTSGRYALWNVVEGVLDLAGPARIVELYVATLGFSKDNIAAMCQLLDEGRIGALTLVCSHYFKGTSGSIYDYAATELAARAQRFVSVRNHAKALAIALSDGRTVTVISSANLRSCKNIEVMLVTGDPAAYRFHSGWIGGLLHART
ncbi:hypothetical protein [Fontivita pretiosa]|uniref:hypothetical protein n=1 Tax=Fontivita pretiosa TaxID=2989684 RepID=UPI003D1667A9